MVNYKRILIVFITKNIIGNINNLISIKTKLIDKLRSENIIVDLCSVFSSSKEFNNDYKKILGNFKYEFYNSSPQLSKMCSIFNNINYNEYDWYFKIRPEIYLLEDFSIEILKIFLIDKINCRVRSYEGSKINIPYGLSISNKIKKDRGETIKYNNLIVLQELYIQ